MLPEVNIGLVGHVDHGKTTLTEALSGKWTDTHSEEIKRGISIRLGYADTTFYRCKNCGLYGTSKKCIKCFSDTEPLRTISLVDAPGHETLMATVLSGASLMDGALLIIAANEPCPQPQTQEHLTALNIVGVKNIVVVQNKIDLVTKEEAIKNYEEIKNFLKGSVAENAPIIPVSAQRRINIEYLIEAIEKYIPTPQRDRKKPPKLLIARSFDVNKPGTKIEKLRGGVVGGSLIQGELRLGDGVEIRPGINIEGEFEKILTKVSGLQKGGTDLDILTPGGLAGVSTTLDPYLTKSDALSGNVLGHVNQLPPVFETINLRIHLLERVVGIDKNIGFDEIKLNEPLMLTVGTTRTLGIPYKKSADTLELKLKIPVCAEYGDRAAIAKQFSGRWRLIGWGEII
ncbi:MAG TPA: translation initiation factor IF-2 subunit gamma [Candidatus Aenigmarchaeota archaeon]|nr:translation initiation factor IF-2 subunit gamma [Candidatus Aenigmarchaeota archaeon]